MKHWLYEILISRNCERIDKIPLLDIGAPFVNLYQRIQEMLYALELLVSK